MPSVEVLAIGSPTAPNSKLCRPSRSATLAARTTWPTAPWTSEPSVFPLLPKSPLPGHRPCAHQPSRQEASLPAQLAWAAPVPSELLFLFSLPALKHNPFSWTSSCSLSPTCPLGLHKPLPPVQDICSFQNCQPPIEQTCWLVSPSGLRVSGQECLVTREPPSGGHREPPSGGHRGMFVSLVSLLSDSAISFSLPVMAAPPCLCKFPARSPLLC